MEVCPTSKAADPAIFENLWQHCFNDGAWLVIPNAADVGFASWRLLALRLARAVPDGTHRLRAQFRVFTFQHEKTAADPVTSFAVIAPPLLSQYAMFVDSNGGVIAKQTHGPLFNTDVDTATGEEAGTVSKPLTLYNDRGNPYVRISDLAVLDGKTPLVPSDPAFVDQTLFNLREALMRELPTIKQPGNIWTRAANLEASVNAGSVLGGSVLGSPGSPKQSPASPRDRRVSMAGSVLLNTELNEPSADWIFRKIMTWAVEQFPEAELSPLPDIPGDQIDGGATLWLTQSEMTEAATWCGAPVALKTCLNTYSTERNTQIRKLLIAEGGRQYPLRHPNVIALYGLSRYRLVMEPVVGTLEQALLRAQDQNVRWSVRKFLKLAQQVLRGMVYLARIVVHRDIACRSILQTESDAFKIGEFSCAIPLHYSDAEANGGFVPVRWTSPEGIAGGFSPASDVWSFGVMLWESLQYSLTTPYEEHEYAAPAILSGEPLECTPQCPREIYDNIILPCFTVDPVKRPTATALLEIVERAQAFWPQEALDDLVPFASEYLSFVEFNGKRRRGSVIPTM